MEINNPAIKDGDATQSLVLLETPSINDVPNLKVDGNARKKRRRGKTKRKLLKPFSKIPWQGRRNQDLSRRKNRFRKIVLSKTQAPFNNNQFLMEIHKPEPENGIHTFRTPSARTRDSSFSVDSEENYFFSLPEDEEEYLTKEFSSVYEDAQSERLSDMSKNDLIQEYLLLEAKYDNLIRRNERIKTKENDDNKDTLDNERDNASFTDRDSMSTEKDTSGTSLMCCSIDDPSISSIMQRLKEQEEQIRELQLANEKLVIENNKLRQRTQRSSEDSESDSSSSSNTCTSSSCSVSPEHVSDSVNGDISINGVQVNGVDRDSDSLENMPIMNGFHSPEV